MSKRFTTTEIADRFKVTRRQVQYAAQKGSVEPVKREHGWDRLYDEHGVEQIRRTLLNTVDMNDMDKATVIALHAPDHAMIAEAIHCAIKLIVGSLPDDADIPGVEQWCDELDTLIVEAREGMKPNMDPLLSDENCPEVVDELLASVGQIVSDNMTR